MAAKDSKDPTTQEIKFIAKSPSADLKGLDEALGKLNALKSALDAVHQRLAGLSQPVVMSKSIGDIRQMVQMAEKMNRFGGQSASKSFTGKSRPTPEQFAKALGYDPKSFSRYIEQGMLGGVSGAAKKLQREVLNAFNPRTGQFTSLGGAESLLATYTRKFAATKPISVMDMLGGSSIPKGFVVVPQKPVAPVTPASPLGEAEVGGKGGKGRLGKFRDTVAGINREMDEAISKVTPRGKLTVAARRSAAADQYEKSAAQLRAAAEESGIEPGKASVQNALAKAARLETSADELRQSVMATDMKRTGDLRGKLGKARAASDNAEAKRIQQELKEAEAEAKARVKQFNTQTKARNQMLAAGQRAQAGITTTQSKTAAFTLQQSQAAAFKQATYAGTQAAVADFMASGGREVSRRAAYKGQPAQLVLQREEAGQLHTLTATFGKKEASAMLDSKAIKETSAAVQALGSNFVDNTIKVTKWAASVTVLYKTMELASYSMARLVAIGQQTARLDQIFSKIGGSTQQLAGDVMHLAAVNGRATDEAMQSAIQWSRLGLTRVQVNEAVAVSLMAANVANVSAGESTEHLISIMQAYGLRVGNLRTVLGELNQISNTYNVTNADLLDGISRTVGVAKQAGIALPELMGLIGAAVGATGQSGSNIGNAIKSVVTALGNPKMQQKLRSQFKVETTTGGDDVKGMSAILAELYVRYNKLSEAQQRYLLYTVAGKTQSSRLAALLDNYVKAQVLAINAQLNLNSAENENAKIKASLAAQLHGLTAEWEKFVVVQGNRGPVKVMAEMTAALKNLLAVANTPAGGKLATLFGGLALAGGAKTIMAGLSLKSGGSFMGATGVRLAGEIAAMNLASRAAVAKFLGGSVVTDVATRRQFLTNVPAFTGLNPWGNTNNKFGKNPLTWGRAAVEPAVAALARWEAGMGGGSKAMLAFARASQVALVAVGEWAGPLLAIYGVVKLFNAGMEALGLSTEESDAKLAGFNQQAEKAASAADAMMQAANLFNTAQKAFAPEAGFGAMRTGDRNKLINQLSQAAFMTEPDLGKREKLQQSWAEELHALDKAGNYLAINNRLEEQRNSVLQLRKGYRQDEFTALKREETEIAGKLTGLRGLQAGPFRWVGNAGRAANIAELERQQAQNSGKKVQNILDQSGDDDAFEKQIEHTQRYQSSLKAVQLQLESIAEIYAQIATTNPFTKSVLEIQKLETQRDALTGRQKQLEWANEADVSNSVQREQMTAAIDDKLQKARTQMAALAGKANALNESADDQDEDGMAKLLKMSTLGYVDVTDEARAKDATTAREQKQDEIDRLEQERADAVAGKAPALETSYATRQKLSEDAQQQKEDLQAKINAEKANLDARRQAAQFQTGSRTADWQFARADYGMDATDRLLRNFNRLDTNLHPQDAQGRDVFAVQSTGLTADQRGQRVREVEQYEQNILGILERQHTVERDINQLYYDRAREFRKNVLGGGPEQLLRTLAAFRTAFDNKGNLRGLSKGQMMAMNPDFRSAVGGAQGFGVEMNRPRMPGFNLFDPEMMDLQNQKNRVNGFDPDWLKTKLGEIPTLLATVMKDFKLPAPDMSAWDTGAQIMGRFNSAVGQAADALETLAEKINVPAALSKAIGAPYATAQSGGVGGAAGFDLPQ